MGIQAADHDVFLQPVGMAGCRETKTSKSINSSDLSGCPAFPFGDWWIDGWSLGRQIPRLSVTIHPSNGSQVVGRHSHIHPAQRRFPRGYLDRSDWGQRHKRSGSETCPLGPGGHRLLDGCSREKFQCFFFSFFRSMLIYEFPVRNAKMKMMKSPTVRLLHLYISIYSPYIWGTRSKLFSTTYARRVLLCLDSAQNTV